MFVSFVNTVFKSYSKPLISCVLPHQFYLPAFLSDTSWQMPFRHEKTKANIIQESFYNLKEFASKRKWIALFQVDSMMKYIENYGPLSDSHSLFLLECCGSLSVFEDFETRRKLADDAWTLVKKSKKPTLDHFNRVLQTAIENEATIDVTAFLKEITAAGLETNNGIYLKLFKYYCQIGNTNKAEAIFEKLETNGTKFTEALLSSLITGHARANDLPEALRAIARMKKTGVQLGRLTYETLLLTYSEMNQCEEALHILSKGKGFSISAQSLLNAHYHILTHNKTDVAEKVFNSIPHSIPTHIVAPAVIKLIKLKNYEAAFQVVQLGIHRTASYRYGYFLTSLVKYATFDAVAKYCEKMVTSQINILGYERALYSYQQSGDVTNSLMLLEIMKTNNIEIKEHYLYPLICSSRREERESELRELASIIEVLKYDPCQSHNIYIDFVCPLIDMSEPLKVFKELEKNLPQNVHISSGIFFYLLKRDLNKAATFLSATKFILPKTVEAIYRFGHVYWNNAFMVDIFAKMTVEGIRPNDALGESSSIYRLLRCIASIKVRDPDRQDKIWTFLRALVKKNVGLTRSDGYLLKTHYLSNVHPTIIEEIDKMIEEPINNTCILSKLEADICQFQNKDAPAYKSAQIELLLAYAERTCNKADAIYKELLPHGDLPFKVHAKMASLYYQINEYQLHVDTMEHLLSNYRIVNLGPLVLLKYVRSLVNLGRSDEVTKIILESPFSNKFATPTTWYQDRLGQTCNSIMSQLRTTNVNKKVAIGIRDALQTAGYLNPVLVQRDMLEDYVSENQLEKAIELFRKILKDHGVLIGSQTILRSCIKNLQQEETQEIRNALNDVHYLIRNLRGDSCGNTELALAYLSCGDLNSAYRIFQKDNFRIHVQTLEKALSMYSKQDTLNMFNDILYVAKDKNNTFKTLLYSALIQHCADCKHDQKLAEIFMLAERRGIFVQQPSKSSPKSFY